MRDFLLQVWTNIWDFLIVPEHAGAASTIIAAIVAIGGLLAWLLGIWPFRKPISSLTPTDPVPSEPVIKMTLAQFEARLKEERDKITDQLKTAHDSDRQNLLTQLDVVTKQLADPQTALDETMKRVADLEARLEREAKRFGADRIATAKDALQQLDYSKAEALFEDIRADGQIAVQATAHAEFGLGEIAEARVDWFVAAQHYTRAAELDPTFDHMNKAAWLLGDIGAYDKALPWAEKALQAARGTSDEGEALNNLALLLRCTGRYDEAEPLFRQAISILELAFPNSHPHLDRIRENYAVLLSEMAGD